MANYRNNGRKSGGNAVLGVVATILAVAFMFGAGVLGWFTHKWVKGEEAPVEPPTQQGGMVTPGDDNENKEPEEDKKPDTGNTGDQGGTGGTGNTGTGSEQHDASESHGIKLMAAKLPIELYEEYGISPASVESAYTITAKIEPENATVRDVDWTVYFKDGSSTWATGKTVTDYVTIKPGQEASCVVTCAEAFGEPIMVKVASHADSSIFATKQFDYVKRISYNYLSITDGENSNLMYGYVFGENNKVKLGKFNEKNFGTGTIQGNVTISNATWTLKDTTFCTKLSESNVVEQVNELLGDDIVDYNTDNYVVSDPTKPGSMAIPWTAFFKTTNSTRIEEIGTKAINLLKSALSNVISTLNYWEFGFNIHCTLTNTYNEQTIEQREGTITCGSKHDNLNVGISDFQFEDSGNLVF